MEPETHLPSGYSYRVDFNFVSHDGVPLRSKTWHLWQGRNDPPRTLLLHADATLLSRLPQFREIAKNHASFTFTVEHLSGDLVVRNLVGVDDPDTLTEAIEQHPLTIGVTLKSSAIDFSLHLGQGQK